ncbi:MAG: nucleotidyltransferase family protein [Spirochaetaceae bacterium]|nr:nucleotidyltransferase family protein [Spirochaetaceae bacterium]
MKTLEEILETLRAAAPEFKRKYLITKIGVFGSYARGEQTEQSDIDIVYFCDNTDHIGLFELVRINRDFQTLFEIKTDPHLEEDLREEFKAHILEDTIYT